MNLALPDQEIHDKEVMGRRAFGRDKSIFLKDNPVLHYKLDVFMDTRPGGVSVDRLGVGERDRRRISFLDPLGVRMGINRGSTFRGWAQFSVFEFRRYTVSSEAKGEDNPFHAEVLRDGFTTPEAQRTLAYTMCVMASQKEFIPSPTNASEAA